MDHVAIMSPKRDFIAKILSGEKTIESRWYKNRIAPWGKISVGDTIYFKDSGKKVTAKAQVAAIHQYRINRVEEGLKIASKFQKRICLSDTALTDISWLMNKHYVILVILTKPTKVSPFKINKTGFGSACAWISIPNISSISLP